MAVSAGITGASRLRKAELVDKLARSRSAKKTSKPPAGKRTAKKSSAATKARATASAKGATTKKPTAKAQSKKSTPKRAAVKRSVAGKAASRPASDGDGLQIGSVSSLSPKLKRAFASRPRNGEQRAKVSKYYLGVPDTTDLDKGFEYPETYGENVVSLMVRDPYWLFSYWEFAPELRGDLAARIGDEALLRSRTVLRVYDVTETDADRPNGYYDIDVAPEARNWYINVARVEREYCVDVGIVTPDGSFIVIARSNRVTLPPVGPSDSVDEEWVTIEALDELYIRIDGRGGPTSGSGGWGSGGLGSGGLGR